MTPLKGVPFLCLLLLLPVPLARAQAPAQPGSAPGPPEVLVLVYQRPGLGDQVNITYAHTVPASQSQRDLRALAQATGWAVGRSRTSNGLPPVQNKIGPMTGITLVVPEAIQTETHLLPVEPLVTAFRPYKRLALIFFVSSQFQFSGPGDYADPNVQITMERHGAAYTYRVQILNPRFERLALTPPPAGPAAPHRGRSGPAALFAILAAAAGTGVLVYVLLARLTNAPQSSEKESEGKTKEPANIGPDGSR